jgi:pyridoxal 5'-phosphate synthase pdxS subunit
LSSKLARQVEAQILEAIGIDYIDESEVLSPADDVHHINKHKFNVPFVNGCRNLGEALRRIAEGAAMIRTKGEAGTGNVVEAVRHAKAVQSEIRRLKAMDEVPPPPSRMPPCSMDPAAAWRRRLALPGISSTASR